MSDLAIAREHRITVRALLLGDRIETAGLERNDVLSTLPLDHTDGIRLYCSFSGGRVVGFDGPARCRPGRGRCRPPRR